MIRRMGIAVLLLVFLACTEDNPTGPVPEEPIDGIFQYLSGGSNLDGASLWFQGHAPYMFRLVNPDWMDVQGNVFDIEEEGRYWTGDSVLTLDVTRHSPPGYIELYTLAPGENVFTYTLQSDYLTLSGEDWHTGGAWSTEWMAGETAPFGGTYWFQSSQEALLDSFWQGASVELNTDFTFSLANPVEEVALTVVEAGTYEKTDQNITFYVTTRDPENQPELYTLVQDTVEVGYSQFSTSLLLDLVHDETSDSTVWTEGEEEPNDESAQSQSLSGTWYHEVHGNLSSGGVDDNGYYIGDLDYFRVLPSATGTLSVTLSWTADADMDVYLYDAELGLLNYEGATYTQNPESFAHSVSGGTTYYLLVAAYEGSGDYLLTADVP